MRISERTNLTNILETFLVLGLLFAVPSPTIASSIPEPVLLPYTFHSKASIEDYIIASAMKNNYSPKRAVRIAQCEGGTKPKVEYNASSTASGTYQFINSTFKGFCIDQYHMTDTMDDKNDFKIQIECATKMLGEGGESHWSESKYCWKNY